MSTKFSTTPPFHSSCRVYNKVGFDFLGHLLGKLHSNPAAPVELLLVCDEKCRSTACLSSSYTCSGLTCWYGQVSMKSDLHKANTAMPGLPQSPANRTPLLLCGKGDTLMKTGTFLSRALGVNCPLLFPTKQEMLLYHRMARSRVVALCLRFSDGGE